ncbi:hypothetical protein MSI_07720 [Treponema sp. JC4]|uniref:hypothetical protein n=1 Tax=Treponema sp. JC4 TaxID=1124982 RepID=UPI00025B0A28|nr:hypothetical protein [Treponema sp. JC4]EID86419.1 hypothetical protein MSI_07720 [Treponema sp. JC4]
MIDFNYTQIINSYLCSQCDVFTVDDFYHYLKSNGIKATKTEIHTLLHSSDLVFPLINNQYVTRAGVFEGRWFSFKPSKEEIDKGQIILGHRCMPFVNPEIPPDEIQVYVNSKIIEKENATFTMNFALDTFALFGEGYVIPYVVNDKANKDVSLSSVQYSLPTEITLTSWPLKKIAGKGGIKFGDRILCRVVDWAESIVEMSVLPGSQEEMIISSASIERENWYTDFENGLLQSFDKNGPAGSIEEQLAFLYLEHQEELCIKNCGSSEEFLKHTTKIGFSPYGVETRIWRTGEDVPYIGKWNQSISNDLLLSEMSITFTPQVVDAFLEDFIWDNLKAKKKRQISDLVAEVFPGSLHLNPEERNLLMLNMEKRHDIIEKDYNQFSDFGIAPIRKRMLKLFSNVNELICDIAGSNVSVSDFPQQELVILSQLFSHVVHLLEDVENLVLREQFPIDDVALSLNGMEETFEDIVYTLKAALESNKYKGFGLVE